MSAAVRTAIADAASTVDGVQVTPYFRQVTKPGAGMVRLDRMNRSENGFGFMATWQVLVVLSQDIEVAEKWLDEKTSELVEAIGQELIVTTVTPQQLAIDTGNVPCVVIEGTRAA